MWQLVTAPLAAITSVFYAEEMEGFDALELAAWLRSDADPLGISPAPHRNASFVAYPEY